MAVGERERRSARGGARARRRRPGDGRRGADRDRRDAEQGPARRERDPRCVARRRQGRGCRRGCAALPPSRRRVGEDASGADAERDQRRRPRCELDRPPGVHGRARRRVLVRRGDQDRRGGLPRAPRRPARARARNRSRRRGRLRSRSALERGRDRGDPRPRRSERATATRSRSLSIRRRARSTATARTASRAGCSASGEITAFWDDLAGRYPIVSIEDGAAEDDWEAWQAAHARAGRPGAARRRRPVRHEPRAAAPRHRTRASPTRSSSR